MPRFRHSKAWPAPPWAARRAGSDYGAAAEPAWREIDWREHLRETRIAGRRVTYVDVGARDWPVVVLIHGLGGCWQNWLETIPRVVADGRRAIALDLPGFGHSEMPRDEISISGYGQTVEALLEQLEVDRAALIGNSMGGFVGAECAIQYPQRAAGLALVAAAGISTTDLRRRPVVAGARLAAAIATRITTRSEQVVRRPRLRQPLWGGIMRHPQRIPADLLYEITYASGRAGFLPALEALMDYDIKERLPDIRCPTLIVWGAEDMLVPVADADEFERLIGGARKVVMDDTGHVPMIERPQTFNDTLADFLAELSDFGGAERPAATAA